MCEQAHLKMENVLIDDRRIHVDFSQSVAKLWNSWRRGDRDLTNQPVPDSGGRRLELKSQHRPNSFSYVHADSSDRKKGGLMVKQEAGKVKEERKEERDRPRGSGRDDKERHKDFKRSRHD